MGQSLSGELIIIDSLRYIPDSSTTYEEVGYVETQVKTDKPETRSVVKQSTIIEPLELEFLEVEGSGGSEEDEDDIESSGGWETDPPETEAPATEDPEISTDEPDTEEVIDENSDDSGFWNAFTITLVSVGAFVVIGSIGVGSYYLGKNRGISETPPLDIDALEPPRVITVPRARSIFSDAPSERFSRFS